MPFKPPLGQTKTSFRPVPNVIVQSRSNLFLLAARSFSLQRCWFLPDAQADSALWVLGWAMSIVERSTRLIWANKCVTEWSSWSAAYEGEANKPGIDKKGFDIFVKSFSSFSSCLWVCCNKSAWNTNGQILMQQYIKPFPQYLYLTKTDAFRLNPYRTCFAARTFHGCDKKFFSCCRSLWLRVRLQSPTWSLHRQKYRSSSVVFLCLCDINMPPIDSPYKVKALYICSHHIPAYHTL